MLLKAQPASKLRMIDLKSSTNDTLAVYIMSFLQDERCQTLVISSPMVVPHLALSVFWWTPRLHTSQDKESANRGDCHFLVVVLHQAQKVCSCTWWTPKWECMVKRVGKVTRMSYVCMHIVCKPSAVLQMFDKMKIRVLYKQFHSKSKVKNNRLFIDKQCK